MTARRLGLLLAVGSTVLLVPHADATSSVVSAKGVISGSGTTWSIEIENTGTEPIRCFQFQLATPVLAKSPGTPPAGWQLGTNGQVVGGKSEAGIPPGGKQKFTFPTTVPYPPNAGGKLSVSADCTSDAQAVVIGPAPPSAPPKPPPATTPGPCRCTTVRADILRTARLTWQKSGFERVPAVTFRVRWAMQCSAGKGGCRGSVTLKAVKTPRGDRFDFDEAFISPDDGAGRARIDCRGSCKRITVGAHTYKAVGENSATWPSGPAGLAVRMRLTTKCASGNGYRQVRAGYALLVFTKQGRLDLGKSDLDWNGKLDGFEQPKR